MSDDSIGGASFSGEFPRMLDSRYRLDSKLGEGGMGVVYRGMNVTIERPVAIKLLRPEYASNDSVAERFLREAKSAVKIRGAHVVEILDFGKAEDGAAFFVMEILEGVALSDVMKKERRLPVRRAVDITAQICVGLGVAHREGIVHRDLKPANIMLITNADRADLVKILDFGVAKILGEAEADLTRTGMLLGTVDYMAPEQIQGQPVDARTDIYALGVLLYRILTGTKPFVGEGVPAMIYHHINSEPESLRARAPDAGIPEALDDVVRRCMAKQPSRRFADMAEVRKALLDAAEGIPFAGQIDGDSDENETSLHVSVASDWVSDIDTYERHREAVLEADRGSEDQAPDGPRQKQRGRSGLVIGAVALAAAVIALVLIVPPVIGSSRTDGEIAAGAGPVGEHFDREELDEPAEPDPSVPAAEPSVVEPEPVVETVPGPIVVRADAPGSRVFVDGVSAGPAPVTIEPTSFDPVTIRITATGRVPFESGVRPTEEELVVEARLQRVRRRPPGSRRQPEAKAPDTKDTKEEDTAGAGDDFFPMDL